MSVMEETRTREETAPENALLSTGPKTDEGKAVSSMNALKHGARSKKVLLPDEDPAAFEWVKAGAFERFEPVGEEEIAQVEKIAVLRWKARRLDRMEDEFFHRAYAAKGDGTVSDTPLADLLCSHTKEFALLLRYKSSADRAVVRAEKELLALQEKRARAEMAARVAARRAEFAAQAAEKGAPSGVSAQADMAETAGGEKKMPSVAEMLAAIGVAVPQKAGNGAQGEKKMQPAPRRSMFIPGAR